MRVFRVALVVAVILLAGAVPMLGQERALSTSETPPPKVAADLTPAPPARSPVDGGDALLFAIACALWARHLGRRPWLWFFLGLVFQVLAVLALLVKGAPALARSPA